MKMSVTDRIIKIMSCSMLLFSICGLIFPSFLRFTVVFASVLLVGIAIICGTNRQNIAFSNSLLLKTHVCSCALMLFSWDQFPYKCINEARLMKIAAVFSIPMIALHICGIHRAHKTLPSKTKQQKIHTKQRRISLWRKLLIVCLNFFDGKKLNKKYLYDITILVILFVFALSIVGTMNIVYDDGCHETHDAIIIQRTQKRIQWTTHHYLKLQYSENGSTEITAISMPTDKGNFERYTIGERIPLDHYHGFLNCGYYSIEQPTDK